MGVAGIAIRTAVLATPECVQAGMEGNIGTVVVSDKALGKIAQKLGFGRGILLGIPILIPLQTELFKAIGRVRRRAAPFEWRSHCHTWNKRACTPYVKFLLRHQPLSAPCVGV